MDLDCVACDRVFSFAHALHFQSEPGVVSLSEPG